MIAHNSHNFGRITHKEALTETEELRKINPIAVLAKENEMEVEKGIATLRLSVITTGFL